MKILSLSREEHDWKLIPGYANAFRRKGIEVIFVDASIPFDVSLPELLQRYPADISAILHFESAHPLFPIGLEQSPVPTVCFHPDTYVFTNRRIVWSSVFDHVAVFHPGYVEQFAAAGHPGAFLLPHAVERKLYEGPETEREFELGWVGQTGGQVYKTREQWLPKLAQQFRMNDWSRTYTIPEVAQIYRRSRVVVNIGRDDFPQDANLRVFEVLASGAVLITKLPSELTSLGFDNGVHFVGYRDESEIAGLVRLYLNDDVQRTKIGNAAREVMLLKHTYDERVDEIIGRLAKYSSQKLAPARSWPAPRARLSALDFFSAQKLVGCSARQFRQIAGRGFHETVQGASLFARSWLKGLRLVRAVRK